LFKPIHVSVDGREQNCGPAVFAFIPADPGSSRLDVFNRCDQARLRPFYITLAATGTGVAVVVLTTRRKRRDHERPDSD
jgi:hypothetical protein